MIECRLTKRRGTTVQKYRTKRIDMAEHKGHDLGLAATISFLNTRNTGGPYVIVDKDGPNPQRSKAESLNALRRRLEAADPKDWFDWHPDFGPQFRVRKLPLVAYENPFRSMTVSVADIDAGVDYCGTGVIHPLGNAVILRRGTPSHTSTFGRDLSAYRLLDGPAAGKVIYTAEHYELVDGIVPGDVVDTDTVLYHMDGCIEQGWATFDGSQSLAWALGYSEGECSKLGTSFNDLMMAVGVPGGHPRGGNTATGALPQGYPLQWTL